MKTSLFALFFAVCAPSYACAMEKPEAETTQPIEIKQKDSQEKRSSGSYSDGSPTHRLPVTGHPEDLASQAAASKHSRNLSK